jgi:hypothetical protein
MIFTGWDGWMDGWMDEKQLKTHNVSIIVYYARIKNKSLFERRKHESKVTLLRCIHT